MPPLESDAAGGHRSRADSRGFGAPRVTFSARRGPSAPRQAFWRETERSRRALCAQCRRSSAVRPLDEPSARFRRVPVCSGTSPGGRAIGTRRAEHLGDDVLRDLRPAVRPALVEDLSRLGVVDERVRQAELVERRVDARLAQVLTHARADAADADRRPRCVTTRRWRAASSTTGAAPGPPSAGRPRWRRCPAPRAARRPRGASVANGPMATSSTSLSSPRASTSTPSSSRSSAGMVRRSPRPSGSGARSARRRRRRPPPAPRASRVAVTRRGDADAGHDLQHREVPHAVVAGAVRAGDAGAVQHERHAGAVQRRRPSAPGRTRGP